MSPDLIKSKCTSRRHATKVVHLTNTSRARMPLRPTNAQTLCQMGACPSAATMSTPKRRLHSPNKPSSTLGSAKYGLRSSHASAKQQQHTRLRQRLSPAESGNPSHRSPTKVLQTRGGVAQLAAHLSSSSLNPNSSSDCLSLQKEMSNSSNRSPSNPRSLQQFDTGPTRQQNQNETEIL